MSGPIADGGRRYAAAVVIVDDDPGVRDSLTVLLEAYGFRVRTHGSGGALLADSCRDRAGCLVIDHNMPGLDGLDTLDRLRGEGIVAPAILITGRLDPALSLRASGLGLAAVLEKPFAAAQLLRLVRENLDERR